MPVDRDGLYLQQDVAGRADGVDRQVGAGAVAAHAVDLDFEAGVAGHHRPVGDADETDGHLGHQVGADGLVHAAVGMTAANAVIAEVGKVDAAASSAVAAVLLLVIYGGYFLATCWGSRRIVRGG